MSVEMSDLLLCIYFIDTNFRDASGECVICDVTTGSDGAAYSYFVALLIVCLLVAPSESMDVALGPACFVGLSEIVKFL